MTTPSTMLTSSIARDSNTNSGTATYTFRLTQNPAMEASSRLLITFPSETQLTGSTACTDLSASALVCTHLSNVLTVDLGSSVINAQAEFGVIVSNVVNPPSFKSITGFYFLTQTSSGLNRYAELTSTDNLSNSVPSSFQSVSATFSNRQYG